MVHSHVCPACRACFPFLHLGAAISEPSSAAPPFATGMVSLGFGGVWEAHEMNNDSKIIPFFRKGEIVKKLFTVFVVLGTLFITSGAFATTIETPINWAVGVLRLPGWEYGQTFTLQAGEDTYLQSISFYLNDDNGDSSTNPSVEIRICEWSDSDNILFSSDPISTDYNNHVYEWQGYNFELKTVDIGLQLTAGVEYLIWITSLTQEASNIGSVKSTEIDYYAYGKLYSGHTNTTGWDEISNQDLAFMMELGSVSVPIPGAVWLLGSGLVGLAGLRKRQRG
jgi:hypothetical protein